ncbi:unnamed protein product [Rhizophagus irregularis]|nr:unnamed protein product [Rhizophagus irregularis]
MEDGSTPAAFHNRCDNKGATIVVAKVANSEQIVGGYNPFQWALIDSSKSTRDSFIYFFADRKRIITAKVSYSNGDQYSIRNFSAHGLGFGGGCDLYYSSNGAWYASPYSYPKIDGMPIGQFHVDDYEVYQVIKK